MDLNLEVIYSIKEGVGEIRLNRPEVYNSFTRSMMLSLIQHLEEAENNPAVRVIVLTGEGKAFCAGQDLAEVLANPDADFGEIVRNQYNALVLKIVNLPKPVIAAVNGVAAGAGANLAFACDLIYAKESSKFIQAFSKIGLVPDTGGTYFLPRLVGRQKASALMMTGDPVQAPEAKNMGMIYEFFEDEIFEEKIQQIASKMADMPTRGLAYTKNLLHKSEDNSLHNQLEMEANYQILASKTSDYQEGVRAFIEKRKPIFKGE